MNSGYYMLDGGGIDLSSASEQTIAGSWNRAVTALATNKPIYAYNTVYGEGNALSPVPVFGWYLSATAIVLVGATLHITVTNQNKCTVQDVAAS